MIIHLNTISVCMAGSKTNYQCTKLLSLPSPGPPKKNFIPDAFWQK